MNMNANQNNGYRFKAVPTEYKGIVFRSKLEARYAVGLDRLGVEWVYEGKAFASSDGTIYTPDFYLPALDLYFEVKGEMRTADYHRIEVFHSLGHNIAIGHATGTMTLYYDCGGFDYKGSCAVAKCRACGGVYFMTYDGGWDCKRCGAYDGDGYVEWINSNFFEAVEGLR